jgi:hypothetical protein
VVGGSAEADKMRFESHEIEKAVIGEGCDFAAATTLLFDSEYD